MSKVAKKGASAKPQQAPLATTTTTTTTTTLPKVNSPNKAITAKSSGSNAKVGNTATLPSIGNNNNKSSAGPYQEDKAINNNATQDTTAADSSLAKSDKSREAVSIPIIDAASAVDSTAFVQEGKDNVMITTAPAAIIATNEVAAATNAPSASDLIVIDTVPAVIVVTAEPPLPLLENGQVTLLYEQYNEQFPVVASSLTAAEIDEVYCLSFVMPGCRIRLSLLSPVDKRKKEIELEEQGLVIIDREKQLFIHEDPIGTFHGLRADGSYYVYAEQAAEQLALDQARAREIFAQQAVNNSNNQRKDDGRVLESCSCLYGNPCVDEYGCRDWSNRYAVAKQNGWKGF